MLKEEEGSQFDQEKTIIKGVLTKLETSDIL